MIRKLKKISEYDEGLQYSKIELSSKLKQLERTRHLMFWHDCSTISNHSHFLVMVGTMYDPAVHYTNQEYYDLFNINIDI